MWWIKAKTILVAACGVLIVSASIVGAVAAGRAGDGLCIPLNVDTGFYDRKDALVQASVDFGQPVNPGSLRLLQVQGNASRPTKFWFEPGESGKGNLFWILAGQTLSLEQVKFNLKATPGEWSKGPIGDKKIRDLIRARQNLMVDGDFETPGLPGWTIRASEASDEQAHAGKRSLKIIRNAKTRGRALGPVFRLEPATRYMISYWVKFVREDKVKPPLGAISVSLNYLGPDRKRLFPRNYYINRHQLAYLADRHFKDEYFGKWVKLRSVRTTLPGVRYGQIEIGLSYVGEVFLDELAVRKVPPSEPVTVQVGTVVAGGR